MALFDVDPDLLATLVLGCPAVAGLSAGPFGAAATYLPGRRVVGVRLDPTTVEVHVVARYGPTVLELAGQIRAALAGRVGGRQIDIVVQDLTDDRTVAHQAAQAPASTAVVAGPAGSVAVPPAPLPAGTAVPPAPPGEAATGGSPVAARRPSRWRRRK